MNKLLIVEDDNAINELLYDLLGEKYEVTQSYSGTEAKRLFDNRDYDLILLDLMLPGMTGEELIEEIRKTQNTPIIVITAKGEYSVLSEVLEKGANDYIAKPFNTVEVLARIKSQIRDTTKNATANPVLSVGNIKMNDEMHEVHFDEKIIDLTQKEYELLKCFLTHPKKVFTKANLYESVWQEAYFGDDNTVMVHVSRLRNKFKEVTDQEVIKTIWGVGFQLEKSI